MRTQRASAQAVTCCASKSMHSPCRLPARSGTAPTQRSDYGALALALNLEILTSDELLTRLNQIWGVGSVSEDVIEVKQFNFWDMSGSTAAEA